MIALIRTDASAALAPLCGKPLLRHQLEALAKAGVPTVVVAHEGEGLAEAVGDIKDLSANVRFIQAGDVGTGGALYHVAKTIKEDFLFIEGDVLFDIDVDRLLKSHRRSGGVITALAHPSLRPNQENILIRDGRNKTLHVLAKNEPREIFFENLAPTGIYVVSLELLSTFRDMGRPVKMDMEEDLFLPSVYADAAYLCPTSEFVRRVQPDNKPELEEALSSGIVAARNLCRPQKAVFLDRDGVINVFGDYVVHPDLLFLKEDAAPAIKLLNESAYLALCVTNQPIVAQGRIAPGTLKEVHNKMEDLLAEGGAHLNGLYVCPHFPPQGLPTEIPELSIVCECRKPKTGMLMKAKKDFNIDLSASWFVGDTLQDVQTGINAGCRTILITTGDPNPAKKCPDAQPDYTFASLMEAVQLILKDGKD